ncbi:MAG: hypothetical protein N3F66_04485 [Spirochaetes bacterium]|nr:hypothetical protein [Spirochaetota bacterium]
MGTIFYKYKQLKSDIDEFTTQVKNVSKTLITTFADAAEIAYATRSTQKLLSLIKESSNLRGIKEVFFVLDNGTIVAHSDSRRSLELKGNIANDEFYYNIDLILYPHSKQSRELFIFDYFVPDLPLPFTKNVRKYIQQYVYKDINTNSWLVTKAVYFKGKSIGTINCIIVKTPIYDMMNIYYKEILFMVMIIIASSLVFSLCTGIAIFLKQKKLLGEIAGFGVPLPMRQAGARSTIKEAIPVKE